jgi:hypothetical protein
MELPVTTSAIGKVLVGSDRAGLDGEALLNDLRGSNGEAMRSIALGYVMGLLACPVGAHASPGLATSPARDLEATILQLETWLGANPTERARPAPELVREALCPRATEPSPRAVRFARLRSALHRHPWAMPVATAALLLLTAATLIGPGGLGASKRQLAAEQFKEQAALMAGLVLQERRFEKDLFINLANRDRIDDYVRKWRDAHGRLLNELERADALAHSAADRDALQRIAQDLRIYADGYDSILVRIRSGQIGSPEQADREFARYKESVHRVETVCTAIFQRTAGAPFGST